jgi:hypothetical protein
MSFDDWLLESPIPPPNWLPSRSQQLASAPETLRRRFGIDPEAPYEPEDGQKDPVRLDDLTSTHPFLSASRDVSGEDIEAELEAEVTEINPPIIQGWAYLLLPFVGLAMLYGLAYFGNPVDRNPLPAVLGLFGAPIAWFAVVALWGSTVRGIFLDERGVWVRTWTAAWLRRPGISLGRPAEVSAKFNDPMDLLIVGTESGAVVDLRPWPPSARADLVEELSLWGVATQFHGHVHNHRRRRRRNRT